MRQVKVNRLRKAFEDMFPEALRLKITDFPKYQKGWRLFKKSAKSK